MAGGEAEDCRGVRGQRGERTRGRRDGAWLDRADRAASVYRQVRRSTYSRIEGSGVGVSFMAVGSLVLAIHSVGGASLPSGAGERAGNLAGTNRLAQPAPCS